jgi:hypothetical protein
LGRIGLAFRSFFALLFNGKLSDELIQDLGLTRRVAKGGGSSTAQAATAAAAKPATAAAGPADGAVQILALLQRESRLIDFFLEDISAYSDDQIGAAVRPVHDSCRTVLERHLKLGPVIDGVEGATTRLATAGIDAKDTARLKIVGNVPPDGNVTAGVLRHRGWRVEKVDLPQLKAGERALIVAPAEIEVE